MILNAFSRHTREQFYCVGLIAQRPVNWCPGRAHDDTSVTEYRWYNRQYRIKAYQSRIAQTPTSTSPMYFDQWWHEPLHEERLFFSARYSYKLADQGQPLHAKIRNRFQSFCSGSRRPWCHAVQSFSVALQTTPRF